MVRVWGVDYSYEKSVCVCVCMQVFSPYRKKIKAGGGGGVVRLAASVFSTGIRSVWEVKGGGGVCSWVWAAQPVL